MNRPLMLVYLGRPVRPCLSSPALHYHNIYVLFIINRILLLKDALGSVMEIL